MLSRLSEHRVRILAALACKVNPPGQGYYFWTHNLAFGKASMTSKQACRSAPLGKSSLLRG